MKKDLDPIDLQIWLQSQWTKLEKASVGVDRDGQSEKAIVEIEKIVRSYKEKADEGSIFRTVFGFEETVYCALEVLASAYAKVSRFDEALDLRRYVAETVQSTVQGRHRNRLHMQDVRDDDIDHLTNTLRFLVYYSRLAANQGEKTKALQLLHEAKSLSDAWNLAKKRPHADRNLRHQIKALGD